MKTALVTGAARGIGLAIARRFLAEGWRVLMLDRAAETLAAAHQALASNAAHVIHADVSRPEDAARAIREAEALAGRLDALVNNAGVADFGPMLETSFETWSEIMAVNLGGPFLMTNEAAPLLSADGGGAVVNIGSISGLRASTLRVAYGTSKAGVIHLTKQHAAELGEHGIRVNAVCPGPVRTKLAMAVHTQEIIDAYHDAIPLNRYGTEREIGEVIVFLCSSKASYVTGQVIAVDGGFESTGVGLPALRK